MPDMPDVDSDVEICPDCGDPLPEDGQCDCGYEDWC